MVNLTNNQSLSAFRDGDFDKSLSSLVKQLCPNGNSDKFVAEFKQHRLEKLKGMNLETLEEMAKTLIRFLNSKTGDDVDGVSVDTAIQSIKDGPADSS